LSHWALILFGFARSVADRPAGIRHTNFQAEKVH